MWEPRAARVMTLWPVSLLVERAGRLIAELRVLGFLAEAKVVGWRCPHPTSRPSFEKRGPW